MPQGCDLLSSSSGHQAHLQRLAGAANVDDVKSRAALLWATKSQSDTTTRYDGLNDQPSILQNWVELCTRIADRQGVYKGANS